MMKTKQLVLHALSLMLILTFVSGCDITSSPADGLSKTTSEVGDVVTTPSGQKINRIFYEKYGEIEKSIPVETPDGTIYRLITSKMDAEARHHSEKLGEAFRQASRKSADSVDDCISSDRYIESGVRGSSTDGINAPRGYVIEGVGVDIIGRAVADVIISAREILPEGDLAEAPNVPFSSSGDTNVEVYGVIPDNNALVGIGMDNDGKNMDSITLYSRQIDWNTFELTGPERTDRYGDQDNAFDRQLSIETHAALTLNQEDRAFLRGVGAGTGEDVIASDFGSDDIEVLWGRYSLYDTQCLQDLRDSLSDGGGSGGGGGGGGGGFLQPL